MECFECESKDIKKESITHKYTESGLDNITLYGVIRTKCNSCGEEYYNFGDIGQLHDIISESIIKKKGRITGKEIRFLRKYLGYTNSIFAKIVGKNSSVLSRIENGQQAVAEPFDKLVRLLVDNKMECRNYDFHDLFLNGYGVETDNLKLKNENKHWEIYKQTA